MPYTRVGAVKVSNHHVRSPLLDIASSCQTCHRVDQDQLMDRAVAIQDKTQAMQETAERAVFELMRDIAAAAAAGATEAQLVEPRDLHRKSQWRLDFVAAENSRVSTPTRRPRESSAPQPSSRDAVRSRSPASDSRCRPTTRAHAPEAARGAAGGDFGGAADRTLMSRSAGDTR